ncbi:MAG: DUF192 domain-containing protein [Casimicrobiaceae bacterium]
MKRIAAIVAMFAFAGILLAPLPAMAAPDLPLAPLSIGKHKLTAEVVVTPEQRAVGLMNRFSLKPDHGMLFVFERPEPQGFWMKNTFIPLSIAFIAADGRIVNIEDMRPQTEETHWSKGPAMYALEMRKGWFTERGIGPGATVAGIATALKR